MAEGEPVAAVAGFKSLRVDLEEGKDYWFCQCGLSKSQVGTEGGREGRNGRD